MHTLIDGALSRKRTTVMVFVLLLLSGLSTYIAIPKESEPDITIPFVYVSMSHDGISPEDAERMLVRPMERELRSIDGVKEMKASAGEGHASVTLEFVAGFDPKRALTDVRDAVNLAKAKLPGETEEPTVHEVTMADVNPVVTVNLSGPVSERALVRLARDLRERLEALKEVLEVEIGGDREDLLEVIVDPLAMESYGLDQADIFNLISRNNRLVPAGTMDTGRGRFAVKVPAVFENLQDILELPVKSEGDRVVRFRDVARVRRSFKDPTSFARLNGHQAVSLEVKKRPGQNIIETVDQVKAIVAAERALWPAAIAVDYTGDASEDVRSMLSDLQNNVISAILLVVIVIIAALGPRSAVLVGLSIPGSFLTGILVLGLFGYTINIVVLFALIMAVGMLVDGAIVVTEFADRAMGEGMTRRRAYALAARRMAWPIIASTATTLAAFAPLIFWPGIMGEFMKYLPITLIATLTASLLMALLFVPTLGSLIGRRRPLSRHAREQLLDADAGDLARLDGFTGFYARTLGLATRHAWKVLAAALLAAAGVFGAYYHSNLGVQFFPEVEPTGGNIVVKGYGDLSIHEKDALMREVEARLLGMDGIETLYARTGGNDRIGSIRYTLVDWRQRRKAEAILAEARARTADVSGVEIEMRKDEPGVQMGKDLVIELASRDLDLLAGAASRVRGALEGNTRFTNVDDSRPKPGIEWQLSVDRAAAARFGADASLVGNMVQMVTTGLKVGEYRPDDVDDELDIRVRFPEEKRNIHRLDTLRLQTPSGLVPISNFVDRRAAPKVDTIEGGRPPRDHRQRRHGARRAAQPRAAAARGAAADAGHRPPGQRQPQGRERTAGGVGGLPGTGLRGRPLRDGDHPGHPVQQLLPGLPDTQRGALLHRRRLPRAAALPEAVRHRDVGHRRHLPGGDRGQQQHRADRHLQPGARRGGGRLRRHRAQRRPAPAPGAADHGDHHSRPDAHGAGDERQPGGPGDRVRRPLDPVVVAAGDRRRRGAGVRHPADPGPDPLPAGAAGARRGPAYRTAGAANRPPRGGDGRTRMIPRPLHRRSTP